jgi:uncharacterized protein (TIGR03083 family)
VGRGTTLELIDRSWTALQETIGRLDDRQLAAPGPEGWSVKDHLAHLAEWEDILLAVLEGRDPMASLDEVPDGTDALNALLRERHADQPPSNVRRLLDQAHARTMRRLAELGEEGLARPYSAYQPGSTRPDRDQPVLGWVLGNTAEHFDEHRTWIQALIEPRLGEARPG